MIFILPLLSIYFYFIAYDVGDIWLLNVWRIGPPFFILPFVSDVLIFTWGMRQAHISIHTHTHTLITLPFYLTLRVRGYIYKSRQIWNRWSELIQVGATRPAASWGIGEGRKKSESFVFSLWRTHQARSTEHRGKHRKCRLEETLGTSLYVYKIQTYAL